MSLRTPLSKIRALGSAKDGTEHWWRQRITAIANIPLVLGFAFVLVNAVGKTHGEVAVLLGSPFVVILLLLMIGLMSWHMKLGMQVVIEDYVHTRSYKIAALILNNFFCVTVAIAGIYAVLKLGYAH